MKEQIAKYCAQNIEDWDLKVEQALRDIGRRMPVRSEFRDEVMDKVEEWCDDNEVALDFFDDEEDIVEEIIFTEVC